MANTIKRYYLTSETINQIYLGFCPLIKDTCNQNCVCLEMEYTHINTITKQDTDHQFYQVIKYFCANQMFFNGVDNYFSNNRGIKTIYEQEMNEILMEIERI